MLIFPKHILSSLIDWNADFDTPIGSEDELKTILADFLGHGDTVSPEDFELPDKIVKFARIFELFGNEEQSLREALVYEIFDELHGEDLAEELYAEWPSTSEIGDAEIEFYKKENFDFELAMSSDVLDFASSSINEMQEQVVLKALENANIEAPRSQLLARILGNALIFRPDDFPEDPAHWRDLIAWELPGESSVGEATSPHTKFYDRRMALSSKTAAALSWNRCAIVCGKVEETIGKLVKMFSVGFRPINIDYIILLQDRIAVDTDMIFELVDDCGLMEWNRKQFAGLAEKGKSFVLLGPFITGIAAFSALTCPSCALQNSLGLGLNYAQYDTRDIDDSYTERDRWFWYDNRIAEGPSIHITENTPEYLMEYAMKSLRAEELLCRKNGCVAHRIPGSLEFGGIICRWIPVLAELARPYSNFDWDALLDEVFPLSILPVERIYRNWQNPFVQHQTSLNGIVPEGSIQLVEKWADAHPNSTVIDDSTPKKLLEAIPILEGLAEICFRRFRDEDVKNVISAKLTAYDIVEIASAATPEIRAEAECVACGIPIGDVYTSARPQKAFCLESKPKSVPMPPSIADSGYDDVLFEDIVY